MNTAGTVRRGSPLTYRSLPVTAADRMTYRERMSFVRSSATLKGGGNGPQLSGIEVSDEEFPRLMPPFVASSIVMSPDGDLWIGRSHAARDTVLYYDIVSATGGVVAIATVGIDSRVVGFGPGTVCVARTDPAGDLVYLERYLG